MEKTYLIDKSSWKMLDNKAPGYLGPSRDCYLAGLDHVYGEGNWIFGWVFGVGREKLGIVADALKEIIKKYGG
jgi:hypothetical protein